MCKRYNKDINEPIWYVLNLKWNFSLSRYKHQLQLEFYIYSNCRNEKVTAKNSDAKWAVAHTAKAYTTTSLIPKDTVVQFVLRNLDN